MVPGITRSRTPATTAVPPKPTPTASSGRSATTSTTRSSRSPATSTSTPDVDGADAISVITGGFNYYLKGHAAKFTLDAVFALDPLVGIGVSDSLGLRPDTAGDDEQIAVRAQFQLLF